MAKQISKEEKILWILMAVSVVVLIFAFLFLFNAMGVASFYPHFAAIDNALGKYIVVILTFTTAIMLWSNVALRFENKKVRNGLTIAMTAFAFIMTLPLTYVFFSLMAFNANHTALEVSQAAGFTEIQSTLTPAQADLAAENMNLFLVDKIMGVHNIYLGFVDWFGDGAFLWVVLTFLMLFGIVALLEPLLAGICVTKGKILNIVGKDDNGKTGLFKVATLPVLLKQQEAAKVEEIVEEPAEEKTED